MVKAGADLIIGHGAHTMQEIEKYKDRWILYGLGNFMFNAPGRYQKLKAPPFSLVAQLLLEEKNGDLKKTLKLYPIFTNNLKTHYQGRFLAEDEFKDVYQLLLTKSTRPIPWQEIISSYNKPYLLPSTENNKGLLLRKDKIGRYIQINLEN